MARFYSCELGGTMIHGVWVRVGDPLYLGAKDMAPGRVKRLWSVYCDGELVGVKITVHYGWERCPGSYISTIDDPMLQLTPGDGIDGLDLIGALSAIGSPSWINEVRP